MTETIYAIIGTCWAVEPTATAPHRHRWVDSLHRSKSGADKRVEFLNGQVPTATGATNQRTTFTVQARELDNPEVAVYTYSSSRVPENYPPGDEPTVALPDDVEVGDIGV